MRVVVASREKRRVYARMQRLHSAAEERGRTGDLLDRTRIDAFRLEGRARAIGRDEIPAELAQAARERDKTIQI